MVYICQACEENNKKDVGQDQDIAWARQAADDDEYGWVLYTVRRTHYSFLLDDDDDDDDA